jgi:MFS family permease
MMFARRVGDFVERKNLIVPFIGWFLILQGVIYGFAGVMPNLWLVMALMFVSRIMLGVEYAVQETILMKLIPDNLRGRVMTTDRAGEISVFSVSNLAAGWSLYLITPQMLTVISGVLSGLSGAFWFARVSSSKSHLPQLGSEQIKESQQAPLAQTN